MRARRARGGSAGAAPRTLRRLVTRSTVMTRRAGSLFVLLAALVSTFGIGEGGGPGPGPKDAVLYERMEQAVFSEDGFRYAASALEGKVLRGTPLCPDGLQAYAKIAFATFGINV